jgi:uncharacterized protein YjeT (DUF2065 family)
MWRDFGIAISLVLVIEGIMPFLYPGRWRSLVSSIAEIDDTALRLIGLGSMITGIILLYLVN